MLYSTYSLILEMSASITPGSTSPYLTGESRQDLYTSQDSLGAYSLSGHPTQSIGRSDLQRGLQSLALAQCSPELTLHHSPLWAQEVTALWTCICLQSIINISEERFLHVSHTVNTAHEVHVYLLSILGRHGVWRKGQW